MKKSRFHQKYRQFQRYLSGVEANGWVLEGRQTSMGNVGLILMDQSRLGMVLERMRKTKADYLSPGVPSSEVESRTGPHIPVVWANMYEFIPQCARTSFPTINPSRCSASYTMHTTYPV